MFDVNINGVGVVAILDSGASRTVIDQSLASRLGLSVRPSYQAAGLTAMIAGGLSEPVMLDAGVTRLEITPAVLDLSVLAAASRSHFQAVLGQDFLAQVVVDIDFAGQRISARHPSCAEAAAGADSIPLTRIGRQIAVPVQIEGLQPAPFILDLGSSVPLFVSPDFAEETGLLRDRRTSTAATVGAEGIGVSRVATLASLVFAGARLSNVPTFVPSEWVEQAVGAIGLPLLAQYRVQLNLAKAELRFLPNPGAERATFPKNRSGINAILRGDRLEVVHVAENSPAARAGLAAGDMIVMIDGEQVSRSYMRGDPLFSNRPAGTIVRVRTVAGRDHTLILRDYF